MGQPAACRVLCSQLLPCGFPGSVRTLGLLVMAVSWKYKTFVASGLGGTTEQEGSVPLQRCKNRGFPKKRGCFLSKLQVRSCSQDTDFLCRWSQSHFPSPQQQLTGAHWEQPVRHVRITASGDPGQSQNAAEHLPSSGMWVSLQWVWGPSSQSGGHQVNYGLQGGLEATSHRSPQETHTPSRGRERERKESTH